MFVSVNQRLIHVRFQLFASTICYVRLVLWGEKSWTVQLDKRYRRHYPDLKRFAVGLTFGHNDAHGVW